MNYYEGFAQIRERDIREAVASTEPADDYIRPRGRSGFRNRVGSGLIGLGLYLLKEGPEPGLSRAA